LFRASSDLSRDPAGETQPSEGGGAAITWAAPSHPAVEDRGEVPEGGCIGERNVRRLAKGADSPCAKEPAKNASQAERRNVITTPDLISLLAANARPVRRLRPPLTRTAIWLLFAACVLGLLAVGQGVRSDIAERMEQPVFVVGIASSLLTGVLAAIASFMASLPDRPRLWSLLPVPALGVWMSTVGYGCLTNWVSIGPNSVLLGETARCFATLVLTSVPLSLAMVVMLRYAALLRPTDVIITGSLAVAAIT